LNENILYKLISDTAIFYNYQEKYNDSIKEKFERRKSTELGKLKLKVLLNAKQNYIVQLINIKGDVIKEESFSPSLSASNELSVVMEDIYPGNYKIKIIYDENSNKKWDTGDFMKRKQPEKVFISTKEIKILADWDVEEEIRVN
jgi:hypothetical protein